MSECFKPKPAVLNVHPAVCLMRGKPVSKPAAYAAKNSLPLLRLGGRLVVPTAKLEEMLGGPVSAEQIEQATAWAKAA